MNKSEKIREIRLCGQCTLYQSFDESDGIYGCAVRHTPDIDYSKDRYELACDAFVLADKIVHSFDEFKFMIPTPDEVSAGVAYRDEDDLRAFWFSECNCHPDFVIDDEKDECTFHGFIRRNGMVFKPNPTAPDGRRGVIMDMIERVARAIFDQENVDFSRCVLNIAMFGTPEVTWEMICSGTINHSVGDKYRKLARAAIAAMREPTEEMCLAGCKDVFDDPRGIWRLMIDAAFEPCAPTEDD